MHLGRLHPSPHDPAAAHRVRHVLEQLATVLGISALVAYLVGRSGHNGGRRQEPPDHRPPPPTPTGDPEIDAPEGDWGLWKTKGLRAADRRKADKEASNGWFKR